MIKIELFGDPQSQKRPRFSRQGNRVHTYDEQAKLKEGFKWQIKSQYREEPLTVPLIVTLTFFMPIPKSTSAKRKRQMANGIIAHIVKPDIDNLIKLSLDCMNGLLFRDDSQIFEIRARKIYSNQPGTVINLFPKADINSELLYENCARES